MVCRRCRDLAWVCEQHPSREWPHEDCAGPGEPCPVCNTSEPPRKLRGFVSIVSIED